jgi:hypothetical protein
MRSASIVASGVLLSATLFASCTCHKDVAPPSSSTFPDAPPRGEWAKITPHAPMVVRATPLPVEETPAQVVEAKPTPDNLPADFPSDVPVFKDASLSDVQSLANDAHNVIFKTAGSIPDVYRFYDSQMRKNGWEVTQQLQRSTHAFLSFKKGNMIANLTVAADVQNPGKQVIAIMYEQQKPLDFEEF